jgi:hypothetical protein
MKRTNSGHRGKIDSLLHIVMGFVILIHGIERLDNHFYSGVVFILASIIFVSCALFHKKLTGRFPFLDCIFHLLEGFLALVIALEYFQEGKKYIQYLYILATLLYSFAALKNYQRLKNKFAITIPDLPKEEEVKADNENSVNL